MAIPGSLKGRLSLPLIGAPLFIVSNPDLVIEQCKAGDRRLLPGAQRAALRKCWTSGSTGSPQN